MIFIEENIFVKGNYALDKKKLKGEKLKIKNKKLNIKL
jgi:hypothetical protein